MAKAIDRTELLRLLANEETQLIDVLPGREYTESHIPGAISIPLRRLTAATVTGLKSDKPVVVY